MKEEIAPFSPTKTNALSAIGVIIAAALEKETTTSHDCLA
jgi:hypothetical protein